MTGFKSLIEKSVHRLSTVSFEKDVDRAKKCRPSLVAISGTVSPVSDEAASSHTKGNRAEHVYRSDVHAPRRCPYLMDEVVEVLF